MTDWKRLNIIVTADEPWISMARAFTQGVAGASGGGMFLTPCSPTGALPATKYINSGHISGENAALLQSTPEEIFAALSARGIPVTLAAVQGLMSQVYISDLDVESVDQALANCGVQIVVEAAE